MTRVSGQVVYPNTATPVAGAHVEIRAIGSTTDPSAPAFVPAASAEIFSPYKTSADDYGHWHADLIPSDELIPVGCLYSVLYRWDGDTHVFYIDVPASPAEVWVADISVPAGDAFSGLRVDDLIDVEITDPAVGEVLGIIDVIDGVEVWGNIAQTGGGGGGSALTVQLADVTVDNAVTTIDFSPQFAASESPSHEINVSIAALAASVVTSGTFDIARIPDLSSLYDVAGAAAAAQAASQPVDDDLSAIAALAGTGIAVRTAANTWAQRAIAVTSTNGGIAIANGNGVAGDPTLSLDSDLEDLAIQWGRASGVLQSKLHFHELTGSGVNRVRLMGPPSITADVDVLLPDAAGTIMLTSAIGATVQAWDADLDAIAALATTAYGRGFLPLADASAALAYVGTYSSSAIDSLIAAAAAGVGRRGRVRVATTANITIATALNNGDTLDGVSLVTGDLVLVKDQSAPAENGVYVVGVSPARSTDFDTWTEFPGSLISVAEGTANADALFICTSNEGGTLGVTAITFARTVITGELLAANNLSDVLSAATSRANLGLTIGSQVQAWDADLDAIAALGATGIAVRTAANTWAQRTITGTANQIVVTNGDGVSGNPTLALATAPSFTDFTNANHDHGDADDGGGIVPTAIAGMTTDRLIGRDTAGTGASEQISVGGGVEFSGSGGIQRAAITGDVTAAAGGGATTVEKVRGNTVDAGAYASTDAGRAYVWDGDSFAKVGQPSHIARDAGATVSNTTTATTLFAGSLPDIPADSLKVGDIVQVEIWGEFTNNTGANRTFSMDLRLDADTLATVATVAMTTNVFPRYFNYTWQVHVTAIGATGAVYAQAVGRGSQPISVGNDAVNQMSAATDATVATNQALTVDARITMSNNDCSWVGRGIWVRKLSV